MSGRLRVREIDDDEGQRPVRIVRRVVDDISHEGLRVPLRQEGVTFQRLKTWKATMELLLTPYLLIPDQGNFWIVAVRVNPGGMVAFSSAIFAGVGDRNP